MSNTTRRIYAISGVYGCYAEFEKLLLKISEDGFDLKQDELVIIGPLIGQGPSVDRVFDKLIDMVQFKVRLTHVMSWADSVFFEVVVNQTIFEHLSEYEQCDVQNDRGSEEEDLENFRYMYRWAGSGGHAAAFAYAERGRVVIPGKVPDFLMRSVKYYRSGSHLFIPAPIPTSSGFQSALEELEQGEVLYPTMHHGRVGGDLSLMALPPEDPDAVVVAGGETVEAPLLSPRACLIDSNVVAGGFLSAVRFPDWKVIAVQGQADYRCPIPYKFARGGIPVI